MTKNKSLRRALIMSIISILVCSAMLVGATFAWFSDTVSTGVNTIIAGNLKVDIQDTDGNSLVNEELFNLENVLWEPGMMFVSDNFVIANIGTVALQYYITTVMEDINETLAGHGLSEVIGYKVVAADDVDVDSIDDTTIARAEFWASITDGAKSDTLEAGAKSAELVVVLYWAPTANDNLYNVTVDQTTDGQALTTNFSISVYATQVSSEEDGIGPGYDSDASAFGRVLATVRAGVDYINGIIADPENNPDGAYAVLGELTGGDGHYTSLVTLNALALDTSIFKVYTDIAEPLFDKVIEHSVDIYSIAVTVNDYPIVPGDNEVITAGDEITTDDIMRAVQGGLDQLAADWNLSGLGSVNIIDLAIADICINVTITTVDGIATTYTLDFVTSLAESEESQAIYEAVEQGLNDANEAMEQLQSEQGYEGTIELSKELELIDGKYQATVTFNNCGKDQIFNGYLSISALIQEAVDQQWGDDHDNIAAIYVGAIVAEFENDGAWLTNALANWGYSFLLNDEQRADVDSQGGVLNYLGTLAYYMLTNLDGQSCDVVIIDTLGNPVTYTLNFVLNNCTFE